MKTALALCLLLPAAALADEPPTVTLYVAQGGSDNGECSQSAPCATPQRAFDLLYSTYDLHCTYAATVQLMPSGAQTAYAGVNISGRIPGQCGSIRPLVVGPGHADFPIGKYLPVQLLGVPDNPSAVMLYPTAGACISLSDGAALKVSGVGCDTSQSNQDCIDVFRSFLDISDFWFGNCGAPPSSYSVGIAAGFQSTVLITGNYTITGDAVAHMIAGQGSSIFFENNNGSGTPFKVTLMNSPHFAWGFLVADSGSIFYASGVSYVGSATGPKAAALRNAMIETSGHCNDIPGTGSVVTEDSAACR